MAGGTGNSTIYLVDGAFNNDPVNNIGQPMPFPDALEEFKVETGVRPARYGIYTGATVNAVTKAGTNSLHGNLFEFLRDHRFNAKNAFATVDDGLSRHQVGGTLGGPIKQNRMFFFGALQYARNRQRPTDTQAFVPTAAMKSGDFTQVASAACNNGTALTLPTPFVNNRIDPSQFNADRHADRQPAAVDDGSVRPHHLHRAGQQRRAADRVALDWQASNDQRIFGRYFVANFDRAPGYEGTNVLLASGTRPRSRQPRADALARRRLRAVAESRERHALRLRALAHSPQPGRRAAELHRPRIERLVRGRPIPGCASSIWR